MLIQRDKDAIEHEKLHVDHMKNEVAKIMTFCARNGRKLCTR